MAPKARATLTIDAPLEEVWPVVVEIMQTARGTKVLVDEATHVVTAKAGASIFSWGENVSVQAKEQGWGNTELSMLSESAFKLTLVDYGKNRGNLDQLTSRLRERFPSVVSAT
jgi:hypothetical protein